MIQPTKLMRGAFLALAILGAAPLAGTNLPIFGIQAAQAQEQLVASVLFEGNQRFSDDNLIAMVDLAASGIFTQARLAGDIESIRQAYDRDGFMGVTVTARTEAVDDGRIRVVFVINEGQRASIGAVNFTGNNSIATGTLEGVILTKETGILSWLFRDDTYDEQKIAVDREIVRLYYANRGYPDTQVTSVTDFDASRNAYFINFAVVEGERYEYGAVGIETSIPGLNAEVLRNVIQTDEGSRYAVSELQETTQDMAFEATAQGFAFADVRPRLDRDVANRRFNVTYLVDEGPRVYVERVNITGNDKTRDFVIRRELDFSEGDPFNRSMVIRGRQNIQDLGYFSVVDVTTAQGSAPDQVIINIAVTETSTGEYGATAGFSTTDGILGELSLTERNFLGRGQFLRASIGASQEGQTFDFSFTEPRFMGLRVSAGVDAYHRINNESDRSFYGSESTGGQLRFGIPITDSLNGNLFAGIERKRIVDEEGPDSSLVTEDEFYKAFVGYGLSYNALDDRQNPTSGLIATFSQRYIGWDHNLIRTEANARYYVPLFEDSGIVGSVRTQAGIINDLSDDGVNAVEAFSPGASLVRGFTSRGFGPRLESGEYLGATMFAGISAEIEFPIPVLPENYGITGAVFADAGWVGGEEEIRNEGAFAIDEGSVDDPWRASVGASIIWDSPFGPLRGDFAHVLNQASEDDTQVFQLTLQSIL